MPHVKIARTSFENPTPTLILSTLVGLICLALTAAKLDLQTDWSYLFREDDPYIVQIRDYREKFPLPHDIAVLVDDGPRASRTHFLDVLAERLEQEPEFFQHTLHRLDLSYLRARGLFFLANQALEEIRDELRLARPYLRGFTDQPDLPTLLAQFRSDVVSLEPSRIAAGLDLGNRLLGQILGRLESGRPPPFLVEKFSSDDPRQQKLFLGETTFYTTLEDEETFLLLVKPTISDDRISPTGPSVDRIRVIIEELEPRFPGLRIRVTGEPVLLTDERRTCGLDSLKSSAITLTLISILFTLGFGEVRRPAMALTTLVIGLTWTLGFTTLAVGHLNFITVTYISILCGLGIDFGIHLTFRYFEERASGKTADDALTFTIRGTGLDTFVGAVSTALALLVMVVTGFKGIAELGIIAGGGVLLCYLATIVVLPAFFALYERAGLPVAEVYEQAPLQTMESALLKNSRLVALAAVVISVLALPQAWKVTFDYNLLNIQAPDLESIKTELQLTREGQTTVLSAISLVDGLEQARQRAEQFRSLETVHAVTTPTDLVPVKDPEKDDLIAEILTLAEGLKPSQKAPMPTPVRPLARALETLETVYAERYPLLRTQEQFREPAGAFQERLTELRRALEERGPGPIFDAIDQTQLALHQDLALILGFLEEQEPTAPTLDDIPTPLKVRLVGKDSILALLIRPSGNVWNRGPLVQFVGDLASLDPEIRGDPILMKHFEDVIGRTHAITVWVTLAVVLLVTALYLRSPAQVVITFLPTALGVLWMVGFMGWTRIDFNPANFVALPMLVGVGSVFGIHVTHRMRELGSPRILTSSTGPAVTLSALTTMAGFGSLLSASHQGINSLGFVIATGMGANLLTALFLLPCLTQIFLSKKKELG